MAQLLPDAVNHFGIDLQECSRLAALPHMLRKGRLRKRLSPEVCDELIPLSETIPVINQAGSDWLDLLAPIEAIDPGEAQIFATAAEEGLLVLTGDKRALRALGVVEEIREALAGRIVVLESILLVLCTSLGEDEVRRRVQPLIEFDNMVRACFSGGNQNPSEALESYYDHLVAELKPLVLWNPRNGGKE